MSLPPVHLAIVQPLGFMPSLAFLDQARYFRYQFRRLGAQVTIAKNRLREDAINFVFGAHLGVPPDWQQRFSSIVVNLEQLGAGGSPPDPAYLRLLSSSAVVDYDAANRAAYAADPDDVPVVPFLYAPYLDDGATTALQDRPIDLLFFGSLNDRRRDYLKRVEDCGVQVTLFDGPVFGAERDHFVRQAKAVLNCHHYASCRFEQARAFHCLSLGTPVVSERSALTRPPAAFEDAVFWLGEQDLEGFFRHRFARPEYFGQAQQQLAAFRQHDPIEAYADLLAFATGVHQAGAGRHRAGPWAPRLLNLGSGKDYKPGWLNVDIVDRAQPDLVLDLGQPITLPLRRATCGGGMVELKAGCLDKVHANNVLEHVPDLAMLMGNVLDLLRDGGEFEIEVPYERAVTAWQDPTHVRALNENSWIYYTEWFWYLGWFEHRFEQVASSWLDLQQKPCAKDEAGFMRVTLKKVPTSARERTVARTMQADFGGLEDDLLPGRGAAGEFELERATTA